MHTHIRDWLAKGQEVLELLSGPSSHTPDKPPSSQSGLLGAIAIHERDHGFGVALTEREREHERQRMFEDLQRQQLEIQKLMTGVGGMGAMGTPGAIGLNPTMDGLDLQQ